MNVLIELAPLALQAAAATILATLAVGDLYRQRQLRRYRVVIYPRARRRSIECRAA